MSDDGINLRADGLDRRRLLIGGLLTACAGIAYARRPRESIDYLGSRKLEQVVPTEIGPWDFLTTSGLVVPPEDPLSDGLYSQLLTRVYTSPTEGAVMLLIAQSARQTGLLQVHRPEFCYPAGGYALSPIVQRPVAISEGRTISVNQLSAEIPGRAEQVLYWTRVGDQMPVSWTEQRIATARDNLKGRIPDAVLVRLSSIDPDPRPAFERLTRFAEAMLAAMPAPDRKVIVGPA